MWTAGASQAGHEVADARQANLHTPRYVGSVQIYLCECARGLLALAVARKRVDGADVRESTFGHANEPTIHRTNQTEYASKVTKVAQGGACLF